MNACGGHADENVSGSQVLACDHFLFIAYTHSKTSQIVLVLCHETRMLRSLSADQSSFRLEAALGHALNDIRDLFRIVLAACNIIQEE